MEDALQYTQLAVNIIIILLFIMMIVLISLLMKTVKNITEKINKLTDGVMSVRPKVEMTIEKINSIADVVKPKVGTAIDKINSISENVDHLITQVNDNVVVLATVVDKVRGTADNILDFEKRVQSRIEPPVMNTVNTISAISVGVKTFINELKSSKKSKASTNENRLRDSEDFDFMAGIDDEKSDDLNEKTGRF